MVGHRRCAGAWDTCCHGCRVIWRGGSICRYDGGISVTAFITKATDRESEVCATDTPEHTRAIGVQDAAVRDGRVDDFILVRPLGRRPEAGGIGLVPTERRTLAVTCRNGGKTRCVSVDIAHVSRGVGRHRTAPVITTSKLACMRTTIIVNSSIITGLPVRSAHGRLHRVPLRIARQMPTCRTDAPAVAAECHRDGTAVVRIHTRLPVGRVERVHRCIPVMFIGAYVAESLSYQSACLPV